MLNLGCVPITLGDTLALTFHNKGEDD